MQFSRAQVKVTSDAMRDCARARDLVVDGLKGTNYTVSPIKPSEHGGFHAFINLEFELDASPVKPAFITLDDAHRLRSEIDHPRRNREA